MSAEHWLTVSLTVNVVLVVAFLAIAWWSAQREYYIRDLGKSIVDDLAKITSAQRRKTALLKALASSIRREQDLTRDDKRELLDRIRDQSDMVLDIEARLQTAIDRLGARLGQPLVQVSSGTGATNQAGENHEQRN